MGLFKKKIVKKTYDREHMKPVIRASICYGEEVAADRFFPSSKKCSKCGKIKKS